MTTPFTQPSTLDQADLPRLASHLKRIERYMLGHGEWRTLAAIREATGGTEAGCSARLRDLRTKRYGSHTVERRRLDSGIFEYRIPKAGQQRLF